jgi:tetratricopeptide (TPR) repeat protein
VERAKACLAASHAHVCAGEFEAAYAAAEELTAILPGVVDGPAQKVRVALRAGWGDAGLAAAEEAMALAPRSREVLRAAAIFAGPADEPGRAVEYASRYLEQHADEESDELGQVQLALGSALDDLGQVYPAIAHLEHVRGLVPGDPGVLNTLGFVYRRAGEPDAAIERFEEGLRADAGDPNLLLNLTAALLEAGRIADAADALARLEAAVPKHPSIPGLAGELARAGAGTDPGARPRLVAAVPHAAGTGWVGCSACAARVPLGERETLCARCGSVVSLQPGPCPSCTSTGRAVLAPGIAQLCPYCRSGRLAVPDHEAPT